ncbi:MAG: hypothetical protein ACR2FO_01165 [Actinomycetota bacterium]
MRVTLLGSGAPARPVMRDLGERAGVEVSNAPDQESFDAAIANADVAIGFFDSDSKLERQAALAAIAAKVPYVSSGQTAESFQSLSELDDEVKAAGATVVTGLGWAPGITNLMAKLATDDLEAVEEIRITWTGSCLGPMGQLLLSRAIRAFSGDAVVFADETWRLEGAGTAPEQVFFPEPVGWRPVVLCAAAEPLSIPQSVDGVKRVRVKGGMIEPWAHRQAIKSADPWARPSQGSNLPALVRLGSWFHERVHAASPPWSAARVDVLGSNQGEPRTVAYAVVDQLTNLAVAPLVAGAILLCGKESLPLGVIAPEQIFDPEEFFRLLAERGVRLARLNAARPLVK